jgi:hypothetical protein
MNQTISWRIPLALAILALALMGGSSVIYATGGVDQLKSSYAFSWAIALVFAAVGGLVAARHPRNPIGWIFLAASVAAGLGALAHAYAQYWYEGKGGVEALGKAAAWYGNLSWMPFILMPATFLLLLFPDGRLVSRRWRPILWCAAVGLVGNFVAMGLTPGKFEDFPRVRNPIGVESPLVDALLGLTSLALVVGVVGSAASLIVRFRRSRGEHRQQMKWLVLAGVVNAVVLPIAIALYDVVGSTVANSMIMLSVLSLPVAAGIAIRRYRLYDIDVVINRTLVYGALTAILALTYVGSVLLLQLVLNGVTSDSGLAVAASTLGVAALFRPARSRIQSAVDRRFYRQKYDAQRIVEGFSARLRDQVDLGAVSSDLSNVVSQTLQPAHLTLWLRDGP